MQKRRSAFINRIRSQQKDSIKNGIRKQMLEQVTSQKKHKYSPFVISSYECTEEIQQESQAIKHLQNQMIELIKAKFTDVTDSKEECIIKWVLDTLSTKIKQATSQNDIQIIIDCYQTAKNIIHSLRQRLSHKIVTHSLYQNVFCYQRQWENAINLILFRIKVYTIGMDSSILDSQYIDSQLNSWNNRTISLLQQIWQNNQTISSTIHEQIKYILIEISELFILLSNSQRDVSFLSNQIFDQQMVKHLSFLLRLHFIDETTKIAITELFLEITKAQWENVYKRILENDYIDYIRMVIAYEQQYKQNNLTKNNKLHKRIVNNMLQFIVQASYLTQSDQFWEKGLCSELLAVQKQGIKDKKMRYNIITALFVCTTTFKYQRTLSMIEQSCIFQWILQIINETIDTSYGDQLKLDIITDGIYVIRFFFELGEQIQNKMNPYRLKMQYSSADMILSKCKQGRDFLKEIGWQVQQL